ncbi:MAG TPA: hydroxymyristoyl-ACP dehydratase [Bacteroidia bacterium]|nr:hydroxymyristoyl-ACP dehydratase [Bacteroidia bacterium]HNS11582.1 hydroxymyristoyl-ACP dehydratase [Bacteroidia bacterium]
MLRDQFYKVISVRKEGQSTVNVDISLNPSDPIFAGHFPSVPVVPGVCMLQMIKETLEGELKNSLQLSSAAGLKFLSVINPLEHRNLTIRVEYKPVSEDTFTAEGSINAGDKAFFKLVKAVYIRKHGKA